MCGAGQTVHRAHVLGAGGPVTFGSCFRLLSGLSCSNLRRPSLVHSGLPVGDPLLLAGQRTQRGLTGFQRRLCRTKRRNGFADGLETGGCNLTLLGLLGQRLLGLVVSLHPDGDDLTQFGEPSFREVHPPLL